MADVLPFRGLRYNAQLGPDISALITPPYDVISPEERLLYHELDPRNFIRLELGQERPGDSPEDNKYTRSAAVLSEWLREGVLVAEDRPAFYLVEHRFPLGPALKSRWGLLARVRLEDFAQRGIRPHEVTLKGPSADRLRLLQACRANFSPIMGIFRARRGAFLRLARELTPGPPQVRAVDSYGVEFRMWVVTDAEGVARITEFFPDRPIYIADGHHRYETALHYCRQQEADLGQHRGDEPFNFVLMSLTESQDPGLVMLPTHRLVRGLENDHLATLKDRLSRYFHEDCLLPPCPALSDRVQGWLGVLQQRRRQGSSLGLYGLHGDRFAVLTPRDREEMHRLLPADRPASWQKLDVSVLHGVVLGEGLGLDNPESATGKLEYTRDPVEAVSLVESGEFQLAFFLNPTPVSAILAVADDRARMPQKSTYFYPKTPAGLVMNPLWQ